MKKISDVVWEIPKSYKAGMLTPARIIATKKILQEMDEQVYEQLTNVATLPGLINHALCMPDGHSGYGFPIGGVAAMDAENGVISPGGIGFDINCGMRLVLTNLTADDVKPHLKKLVDELYLKVPAGVGSKGFVKLSHNEFKEAVEMGAKWCVEKGYGWEEDLRRIEEDGCMEGADSSKISIRSIQRGVDQIGTLGSGNHYLEIQVVKPEFIFDKDAAKTLGIFPNQVVIMFHCGSRGFGHQVATDYLQTFLSVMHSKYGIRILDRELACAPFNSPEGQNYFAGMKCGVNMSFMNRQVILHRIREVFSSIFRSEPEDLGLHMVYDVAHNTAKLEKHTVNGEKKEVLVHRKGATKAFGPNSEGLPPEFAKLGQPVIIGGSMETGSYLLLGTETAMKESFGSTCHGSGRTMSRTRARHLFRGDKLQRDMEQRGIYVKSVSYSGLAEEAGAAYKDIDEVVGAVDQAGISKKVVRFIPIGNVKG
ncbi:MAG: RtcB family protein [Thaumarchaeota archaeon]|nr:RtcB family protein [Nitrososphaerota archaeon]